MKRKLLVPILLVSAAGGVGAWAILRGQSGIAYRTVPVQQGEIAATVSATGTPNAVVNVQVGSQVSGNIMALYADFNTKVKKDQVIARIDPAAFQARVDQARATLEAARASVINGGANVQKALAGVAQARASLANVKAQSQKARVEMQDAKTKLDRRIELANAGVLSREERETAQSAFDTSSEVFNASQAEAQASQDSINAALAEVEVAKTQQASAQAQVKQAQAALQQAMVDLDHTYIRAPVDGIVVARNINVGQTVAASMQAPILFEIAQDLTKMQVDTNVSEADIGRVKVGQRATFTVDAFPKEVFRGQVVSIRQAPLNVQNVVTYDVVVAVPNPDLKLFPGMTANVKILTEQRDDAIRIPNAALRFRPPDTRAKGQVVYIQQEDKTLRAVPVQLGITDGEFTEITSGDLKPGERIVVAALGKDAKKQSTGARPAGSFSGGGRRGPGF